MFNVIIFEFALTKHYLFQITGGYVFYHQIEYVI